MPVSVEMKNHLLGTVTLAVFMKITAKDGDIIRVWNGTRNKIVGGETYVAYPIAPSRLQAANGLKADNLEVTAIYGGLFNAVTLRAKKWQGARVEYRVLNYRDFTMGYAERRVAFLGKTEVGKHAAKVELNSLSSKLNQPWGRSYNMECDVDELGDLRCTFDLNGYTANGFRAKIQAHVVAPILNRQQFSVEFDQTIAQGLRARYYTGTNFTALAYTRSSGQIMDNVWTGGSPSPGLTFENYSIEYDGKIIPTFSGVWTIEAEHDNGVRAWVDDLGTALIDNWLDNGTSTPATDSAPKTLTAGVEYNFRVRFNQGPGASPPNGSKLHVRWSHASQSLQVIPVGRFLPPTSISVPDGFYNRGKIKFLNGPNEGLETQILVSEGGALTLYLPLSYTPTVGDDVELTVGCNRTIAICRDVFGNAINHRGFAYLPGRSKVFSIPE